MKDPAHRKSSFFRTQNFLKINYAVMGLSCSMWDLVSRPGIEPGPPALGMWSFSYWITREVPRTQTLKPYVMLSIS